MPMTGEEIVALSKKHTLFDGRRRARSTRFRWRAPKGVYFWTPEGKRFIDFNSQLMCVNIGHGDERVIAAIQRPGGSCAYAGRQWRPSRERDWVRSWPTWRPVTSTCSSSPTAAPKRTKTRFKIARAVTGRPEDSGALPFVPWRHRRRHRRNRRSAPLVAARDSRRRPRARSVSRHRARVGHGRGGAALSRGGHPARRAATIAAFILETVTGTNGILIPPDGYLQGVRALCDRYGILHDLPTR